MKELKGVTGSYACFAGWELEANSLVYKYTRR